MRIVCPNCQATYEVPDAILAGTPRPVRCARCGAEWLPSAAPPTAELSQPPEQREPEAPPPRPPPPLQALEGMRPEPKLSSYRPRGTAAAEDDESLPPQDYESPPARRGALIGWAVTAVVLLAVTWGAISFRTQVMAAWPPSERVYGALGLR